MLALKVFLYALAALNLVLVPANLWFAVQGDVLNGVLIPFGLIFGTSCLFSARSI